VCSAISQTSPKVSERSRQKQEAEQKQAKLRQQLSVLKEGISKTEKAREHAADALANSEAAISNANRALRELAAEQTQTETRLAALSKSESELETAVSGQRAQLAKMLREQHVAGHDDRVRLLLSGENPNQMSRELRYLGYVSAAQSDAIAQLEANLAAIEANKKEAEEARLALEEIAEEQRDQKALLEKEKSLRKTLVTNLSSKLRSQRKEAGNLARDEERMAALVDRLATVIAQQRKAEEEKARKRRAQRAKNLAIERERAEAKRAQKGTEKAANKAGEKPGTSASGKEPARAIQDDEETDHAAAQGSAFASLRGKLRMPVNGELLASFGAKRSEGPSWKGLFIKAPEGTDVKSVAAGEVIFADWMRGFGNLLIVDHGGQYMSIYGNNQSVLKRPGDKVKAGDTVAAAGNSGGNEQSGLYFEMRYQGRAIDPLAWINR